MKSQSLFILVIGALAACGNSKIAIHDLPGQFTATDCNLDVECNDEPDQTTCKAALGAQDDPESETLLADVDAGTVKYDADAAQACLDDIGADPCQFTGFYSNNATDCQKIFSGTVAQGGACFISQECAGQATCTETVSSCDRTTTCCPGTCSAPPPVLAALGAACDQQTTQCVATTYCKLTVLTGTAGTCTAPITMNGAACDSDVTACADPMYCNLDFQTNMGTCKTPAASGATCSNMDLLPCVDSRDYCDSTTTKCTRRVAVGAACNTQTGPDCIGFAQCVSTTGTGAGTCTANPKLGEACTDTGPSCLGNLTCTGGTCVAPAAGAACH